jgi:HAD superfamily hydrolase (TIGR01509 family)
MNNFQSTSTSQKRRIQAVIFDMDGLMIDSEPFHQKAFDTVLKEYGSGLSIAENNSLYVGIGDIAAAEDMVKRKQLPISKEELIQKKQTVYMQYLQSDIIAQDGLRELLIELKRLKFKTAVASGSTLDEIKAIVTHLKINEYFDFLCSSSQVSRGKPAPDIFLFAASKLGVNPTECIVLEDAPSGLRAGIAANMHVIIVPSRETVGSDFMGSDAVLTSLKEVSEYIKTHY